MRLQVCALVVAAALVTAGCSSAKGSDDPATWAAGQDHVAEARLLPYDDPSQGSYLLVTLDTGLSDDTVHTVVDGLKEHFDEGDAPSSVEIDVDGFVGSIYPGVVNAGDPNADPDLSRALWLRADGRATSYGDEYHSSVSSHPRAIAPAADVAQLALDLDAAVEYEPHARFSMSVESADGSTGVEWTTGRLLDPAVVGPFAQLQQAHPGTTGWLTYENGSATAFLDVDPDEVPFADVASGKLVDPARFAALDLGWGPARAPADRFATVFADPATRTLLDDLRGIDGVAEVGPDGVVVRTGAAFAKVRAYAATSPTTFTISLQRRPVLYDYPSDPVFTSERSDPARITAAYASIADLPGIARLDLNANSPFGNLTVSEQVTPTELQTAFTTLAKFPAPYDETDVFATVPGDYGHDTQVGLGAATASGFTPYAKGGGGAYPDLVSRVAEAWDDARTR